VNEDEAIFIKALQATDSLPAAVRERATAVQFCERSIFDQSYLEFLQLQIDLQPRGPEWTAVLAERLSHLAPYCGLPTLFGTIIMPGGQYRIRIDPQTQEVIHYELHDWPDAADQVL
jgi:hypothetical protein